MPGAKDDGIVRAVSPADSPVRLLPPDKRRPMDTGYSVVAELVTFGLGLQLGESQDVHVKDIGELLPQLLDGPAEFDILRTNDGGKSVVSIVVLAVGLLAGLVVRLAIGVAAAARCILRIGRSSIIPRLAVAVDPGTFFEVWIWKCQSPA